MTTNEKEVAFLERIKGLTNTGHYESTGERVDNAFNALIEIESEIESRLMELEEDGEAELASFAPKV